MSDYPSRVQAYNCLWSRNLRCVASVGYALLLVACAHRPPEREAAFREIQVHEATVAHGEARLAQAPCREAREQTAAICTAKNELCDLSGELRDPDATARCLRAGDACGGAHEHVLARCATDAPR